MIISGMFDPLNPYASQHAPTVAQNSLPPWQIVIATLKSMRDYAGDEPFTTYESLYHYMLSVYAPDFADYMPGMIKYLNLSAPNMTFTPEHINYAANYFGNYREMLIYSWTELYWAFVDALSDRTFPKITAWHPVEYYTKPPMVITAEQYAEAVRLSNDPKNLLIYAVTQIIRNHRTQYNEEPIIEDVMEGIIKIIPGNVTFTEPEIEFANYMINSNTELELIYSYQTWYEALLQTLSGRIIAPIEEPILLTEPVIAPITFEPFEPAVLPMTTPGIIPEQYVDFVPSTPVPLETETANLPLIGGALLLLWYIFKWI